MVCLDTDVMIDYIHQVPHAVAFVQDAIARKTRLTTTVMSVCELYKGADQSTLAGRNKVGRLLEFLEILELDMRGCSIFREYYHQLGSKGQLIGEFDILIACIAMANGESLATGNSKHFSKVPGLRLEKF
jgi:predicted nucleic acid-binding protein